MSEIIQKSQIAHNLVHSSPMNGKVPTADNPINQINSSTGPSTTVKQQRIENNLTIPDVMTHSDHNTFHDFITMTRMNNPFVDSTITPPSLKNRQHINIINEDNIPKAIQSLSLRHSSPMKFEQDLIISSPGRHPFITQFHHQQLHQFQQFQQFQAQQLAQENNAKMSGLPRSQPVSQPPATRSHQKQFDLINKNLSIEFEIDKDFLTSEFENQDEAMRRHEIYRNLYGTSPSQNSRILKSQILQSKSSLLLELNNQELEDSMSQLLTRKRKHQQEMLRSSPMGKKPNSRSSSGNSSMINFQTATPESMGISTPRRGRPKKRKLNENKENGAEYLVTLNLPQEELDQVDVKRKRKYKVSPSATSLLRGPSKPSSSSSSSDKRVTRNSKKKLMSDPNAPDKKKRLGARSKTGCWTCRIRHKACPEEKPACSQCTRLGLTCDYQQERPPYMCDPIMHEKKLKEIRNITNQSKRINFLKRRKGSGLLTNDESRKLDNEPVKKESADPDTDEAHEDETKLNDPPVETEFNELPVKSNSNDEIPIKSDLNDASPVQMSSINADSNT